MHYVLSFSSEKYPLAVQDLKNLPAADISFSSRKEVIVLLGGNDFVPNDCLLSGKKQIQEAIKSKKNVVPVRIAFTVPTKFTALFALIKKVRYRWKTHGTGIYHIDPLFLRTHGLERIQRNAKNAYQFSNHRWKIKPQQQKSRYQALLSDMEKGYDDSYPMRVMLCRKRGTTDSLDDGHHRLSICIDRHISPIALSFCYASSWQAVRQIFSFNKKYLLSKKDSHAS